MNCLHYQTTILPAWIFWIFLLVTLQKADGQCSGAALTVTAGTTVHKFTSPNYPTSYANGLTCEWLIDSGVAGQQIILYSDKFDHDCSDKLYVYDGSTTGDPVLANALCGSNLVSSEYVSSGQFVLVRFVSDASGNTGTGFELSYFSAPDTSATGCTSEYTLTASATPQYLTSSSFPNKYSSDSACRWLITAPGSLSTIQLELVWSDIEVDANCAYDKLEIYSGSYVCENQLLVTDCSTRTSAGATPTVYSSTGNSALVVFTSDDSFQKYGFALKYSATIVTTAPTTASTASTQAATVQASETENTVVDLNIPLMVVSGIAGAGLVLGILAIVWAIKHFCAISQSKKGITMVQSIAPLPARPTVHPTPPNALSFV